MKTARQSIGINNFVIKIKIRKIDHHIIWARLG